MNAKWYQYIPQKNLGHVTPVDKLKEYHRVKPELFQKKTY